MAFIQKFFTGYQGYGNGQTRVGELNRLWYDSVSNSIRIGDGTSGGKLISGAAVTESNTPPLNPLNGALWWHTNEGNLFIYYGGNWVPATNFTIPVATDATLGGIVAGPGFTVALDGTLGLNAGPMFDLNSSNTFMLKAATSTQIGGIKAGVGLVVASDGTVNLDTAGLNFAFGDFYAFTNPGPHDGACLSSVNANQDINIVSNGSGIVNVIGEFNVHTTDEGVEGALSAPPVFTVNNLGQTTATALDITNALDIGFKAPLNVSINGAGLTKTPTVLGGLVAQFTGRDEAAPAMLVDAYGIDPGRVATGGLFVFRTGRGTNASPTAVQSGDILGQLVAAGWAATGQYGGYDTGGYRIVATESYTATARGSKLELFVTPNTTLNKTVIATVDSTGITLASGKVFTGNVTGDVSGNAGTVTNGVVTTGSYANPAWITSLAASKVGLSNVTNESKATMFTSPTFTGTVSGITATMVGLGNVTNESKATMFTSPTFTGTVAGVTATMVGLGNVTNESKATMFTSPTFTGTVSGVTKSMVGLGSVENTALSTSTYYIGTTQNTYGRASASQTLTGVSISGNAGTVTNGVYTTDTGTVTNLMLAGSIANNKLTNSTISGVALGSNLATLTIGTHLTGTSYNGSTAVTIATDATTDATASVLVARDSNGLITAQNYKGNSRDVGTLGAGATLTINYATDHHVLVNITGAITIAHTNITAGRNVKVIIVNATGGNLAVTTGLADINTTGNNANANLNSNRMGAYEFISFGTTTSTIYCNSNK